MKTEEHGYDYCPLQKGGDDKFHERILWLGRGSKATEVLRMQLQQLL